MNSISFIYSMYFKWRFVGNRLSEARLMKYFNLKQTPVCIITYQT